MVQNCLSDLSIQIGRLTVKVSEASFHTVVLIPDKLQYHHCHKSYELHYVTEGCCTFLVGSRYYPLAAGDYLLVHPGVFHSMKDISNTFEKLTMAFELDARGSQGRAGALDSHILACLQDGKTAGGRCEAALTLCTMLFDEMAADGAFSAMTSASVLELILLHLLRCVCGEVHKGAQPGRDLDSRRNYIIDEFFNDHFNLSAGQEELSALLGVSRRQLDRILKKNYGMTFQEKKAEMRTQIATDFLLNSRQSIQQIAETLGYSSPSNFTTFFKNRTGLSPSQLRSGVRLPAGGE